MLEVYRCNTCGREVLVRKPGPMSPKEVARRRIAEMQPRIRGARGKAPPTDQLRDDIWAGISSQRTEIPRLEPPEKCPACHQAGLTVARTLEQ
ncbi:MAG: hypothetical protein P8J64_07755 [Dehalococcoidia bacterium]|nr:hypothetical protein [Dehalococcoidia bacterium]